MTHTCVLLLPIIACNTFWSELFRISIKPLYVAGNSKWVWTNVMCHTNYPPVWVIITLLYWSFDVFFLDFRSLVSSTDNIETLELSTLDRLYWYLNCRSKIYYDIVPFSAVRNYVCLYLYILSDFELGEQRFLLF